MADQPEQSTVATNPAPATPPRRPRRRWAAPLLAHGVAAVLMAVALFFYYWLITQHPALFPIFQHLLEPWQFGGGSMDWPGLAWGVAGVAVFTIIGRFYLEGLEIYISRSAMLALAYIFGLGLSGFIFECLAIPHQLTRLNVTVGLVALLAILGVRAWRRTLRPPESGAGGDAGSTEHLLRRKLAQEAYAASLRQPPPGTFSAYAYHAYTASALFLIGAITFAIFWHSLLYPEVYWDSLILYLGYARMTFLEQGFPVKVTGQVGIGLGANYPHLFAVLGSGIASMAGGWSELPQRLIAPLCGLASTVLVYHTALRLTRRRAFSLTIALLYRSIPLGIIYDHYASDYALAILFSAAFLYLALLYLDTALTGYFAGMTLLVALSMHLNYLMGIYWLPWALTLMLAHVGWTKKKPTAAGPAGGDDAEWTYLAARPRLYAFVSSHRFWNLMILAILIGSTWHIRNWIVTGNPVYAFYYKIFGGHNINPEVMAASEKEWIANGSGIARLDEFFNSRLEAAWYYFVKYKNAYQISPVLMGFSLTGLLLWLAQGLGCVASRGRIHDPWGGRGKTMRRFGVVLAGLTMGLLTFHFVLAPYYLYQICPILPCLALLAVFGWPWWRMRPWGWALGLVMLLIGLVPGLAFALMGFKVVGAFEVGGQMQSPLSLYPFRHPLPETDRFYRWRFGDDQRMWEYLNKNLKNERLLTHENRHLVLDPSITLVHLDDWDMQKLWKMKDPAERVRRLIQVHKIHYYLFVPNELATPTNVNMGAADWPKLGLAEEVYTAGNNRLYRLIYPSSNKPQPTPALTPTPTLAPVLAAPGAPAAPAATPAAPAATTVP